MLAGAEFELCGEGGEALLLVAVTPAKPDFPPSSLGGIVREKIVGIGPQFADGGSSDGLDALDEYGMARLVLPRGLDVGGQTLQEVLLLAVRDVDRRDLDRAVCAVRRTYGYQLGLIARPLDIKALQRKFKTGKGSERDVCTVHVGFIGTSRQRTPVLVRQSASVLLAVTCETRVGVTAAASRGERERFGTGRSRHNNVRPVTLRHATYAFCA